MRRISRVRNYADRGMSTVEYVLGTLAAAAFALGLMKILTSAHVAGLVTGVVERALSQPF
jgi:hypothetical protein